MNIKCCAKLCGLTEFRIILFYILVIESYQKEITCD